MIEIKPFSNNYLPGVIDVILPIQQSEFNIPITLDEQPDLLAIQAFYQQDKGNFWVALDGSEVIGTIALIDIGNNEGAIRKMFVKEKHRGSSKGVAKRLLNIVLSWGRQNNYSDIYLGTTPKFFAAHRFYEKNSFIEIKKDGLPEYFPVMEVDKKFYRYSFELQPA